MKKMMTALVGMDYERGLAMLKDYGRLLAHTPLADRARNFAAKCRDATEIVAELGAPTPPGRVTAKGPNTNRTGPSQDQGSTAHNRSTKMAGASRRRAT